MQFADHMDDIFDELKDLNDLQRHSIKERYRFLMEEYRYRCRLYSIMFYIFRITMTVGSLAVPALLSIQNGNTAPSYLYWVTWTISLAVTTSNGIMTLFKLDKQFFNLHATAERLRSETWQFVQLAGRYSGHHGNHKPTHSNQYVYYCSQLEKINMSRVDDEYVKAGEETRTPAPVKPSPDAKPSTDTMVPSPADQSNLDTPIRDSISLVEDDDGQTPKPTKIGQKSGKTVPLSIKQESPASSSRKTIGTASTIQQATPKPTDATATATATAAAGEGSVSVSGFSGSAVPSSSDTGITVLPPT